MFFKKLCATFSKPSGRPSRKIQPYLSNADFGRHAAEKWRTYVNCISNDITLDTGFEILKVNRASGEVLVDPKDSHAYVDAIGFYLNLPNPCSVHSIRASQLLLIDTLLKPIVSHIVPVLRGSLTEANIPRVFEVTVYQHHRIRLMIFNDMHVAVGDSGEVVGVVSCFPSYDAIEEALMSLNSEKQKEINKAFISRVCIPPPVLNSPVVADKEHNDGYVLVLFRCLETNNEALVVDVGFQQDNMQQSRMAKAVKAICGTKKKDGKASEDYFVHRTFESLDAIVGDYMYVQENPAFARFLGLSPKTSCVIARSM
jgi:hypothetical protein